MNNLAFLELFYNRYTLEENKYQYDFFLAFEIIIVFYGM